MNTILNNKVPMNAEQIEAALAAYLLDQGKIQSTDLSRSQSLPEKQERGLGLLLSQTGLVSEKDIAEAYSKVLTLPLASDDTLEQCTIDKSQFKESYLRSALLLPLVVTDSAIEVLSANPEDQFALDALRLSSSKTLSLSIATKAQIEKGLDTLYEKTGSQMDGIVEGLDGRDSEEGEVEAVGRLRDQAGEAPVIRLVNLIIQHAVEARASDIHIEAFENLLKIRYRIDGHLQVVQSPPAHSTAAIISRIKLMAKLNIAERRLPQDGGFQIRLQGKLIDLRVSTTATLHGESLVLRVLDQQSVMLDLVDLGFSEKNYAVLKEALRAPNGVLLVTGPTGSGKTTTLYSMLKILNTDERKIMTVEDPIEYQLTGINQIQVKPDIGLAFSTALRSIVRQDPDIIMIGEIRDLETARTAVQSALTGHLVLSTLHTNDAGSSITRLLDMGIEHYLLPPTVNAIVAQRLVRKLCQHCKQGYTPSDAVIDSLKLNELSEEIVLTLFSPVGCKHCNDSGYSGRSVIAEILVLSDVIRQAILSGADGTNIQTLAIEQGMLTMSEDGIIKALKGMTTIEEVTRVTFI